MGDAMEELSISWTVLFPFLSKYAAMYLAVSSIPFPLESLSEPSLDFIVALPMTQKGYNAIMSVTDRFSKYVRAVPGKSTLSAEE